jgi:allantoin racemase
VRIAVYGSGVATAPGRPPAHLVPLLGADDALDVVPLRAVEFPHDPARHVLVELVHLDAALRARTTRPDAVFVDTFGEYALDAARARLDVPVVGAAEAAFERAAAIGAPFAIVTVWPRSLDWLYRDRLRRHDATSRCTGVWYVGEAVDAVRAQLRDDASGLAERALAACRTALGAGARSVVLGCTCMAPMADALAAALPVPVICASRAGLGAALQRARHASRSASRDAAPAALDALDAQVAAAVAALAVAAAEAGRAPDATTRGAACPVCVGAEP